MKNVPVAHQSKWWTTKSGERYLAQRYPVPEYIIEVDLLGNWKNPQFRSLTYEVRAIMEGIMGKKEIPATSLLYHDIEFEAFL